ncbi:MAG TPA: hypothetical protein VLJ10_01135 [Candidatus Bathyarchaeia archaeon]|nr:hypothetical protein [Candidatus Bathyarchaeia archaeon]
MTVYTACTEKNAKVQCFKIRNKPVFQQIFKAAMRRIEEKSEISNEMIARKLWDLANYDLRKIADPKTGDYLDVHQLDKDTARIIQGFDIDTEITGEGEKQRAFAKRRYKFPNRAEPLIALAKSRGMFSDGDGMEQTIINIIADPRVSKS